MGFLAGFAGGITLTLSLTYLALHTHHSNRQAQSALLRSQASTVSSLLPPPSDPSLAPLPQQRRNATLLLPDGTYRPRASLEAYRREELAHREADPGFLESAKRRWNSEVLSAVRAAQQTDWDAALWRAEQRVAHALGAETWERGAAVPVPPGEDRDYDDDHHAELPPARHHRVSDALHRTGLVAHAMGAEAREVAHEAQEVLSVGMEEARGAVARGVGKAHDLAERARARVHLVEDKAEARVDAKLLHVSDIERALEERFDDARRAERMKRSVEEVLEERYLPMGERVVERYVPIKKEGDERLV